ncbi:MAG: hypothetical protein ACOCXM_09730 [Myxococcota bacterium]
MKNLLGVLPLVLGLALAACGSTPDAPDYPSPEAGKLPGQETESSGVDLDALAADDDREMATEDDASPAEDDAGDPPAEAEAETETETDDAPAE